MQHRRIGWESVAYFQVFDSQVVAGKSPDVRHLTEIVVTLVCIVNCSRIGNGFACGIALRRPSVLILPSESVSCPLEERACDSGNVISTHCSAGKNHLHIKALVAETDFSTEIHHRTVRVTDWAHILAVDNAVTVEVKILDVSKSDVVGRRLEERPVVEFLESIVETVRLVAVVLADAVAGLVHPLVRVRSFSHILDDILGIGDIAFNIVSEVSDFVFPSENQFESPVGNLSDIYSGGIPTRHSEGYRNHTESSKDIGSVLVEIIAGEVEPVVKEFEFDSGACLFGFLPGHILISQSTFC